MASRVDSSNSGGVKMPTVSENKPYAPQAQKATTVFLNATYGYVQEVSDADLEKAMDVGCRYGVIPTISDADLDAEFSGVTLDLEDLLPSAKIAQPASQLVKPLSKPVLLDPPPKNQRELRPIEVAEKYAEATRSGLDVEASARKIKGLVEKSPITSVYSVSESRSFMWHVQQTMKQQPSSNNKPLIGDLITF